MFDHRQVEPTTASPPTSRNSKLLTYFLQLLPDLLQHKNKVHSLLAVRVHKILFVRIHRLIIARFTGYCVDIE